LLRTENGAAVKASDVEYVAQWKIGAQAKEINFSPACVLACLIVGLNARTNLCSVWLPAERGM
jgi:hypothetical protein